MSRPNKRRSENDETEITGTKEREGSPAADADGCDRKKARLGGATVSPPVSISMSMSAPKPKGIHIKLGAGKPTTDAKPKISVASVFNQDSDSEPEEMPPEARMRMRNIGRDTPTSAGPNSFGKTKHGFCDAKKVFEKSLKEAMNNAERNDG